MRTLLCCSPTPDLRNLTVQELIRQKHGEFFSSFGRLCYFSCHPSGLLNHHFPPSFSAWVLLSWSHPWDCEGTILWSCSVLQRNHLVIHVNYSFLLLLVLNQIIAWNQKCYHRITTICLSFHPLLFTICTNTVITMQIHYSCMKHWSVTLKKDNTLR